MLLGFRRQGMAAAFTIMGYMLVGLGTADHSPIVGPIEQIGKSWFLLAKIILALYNRTLKMHEGNQ